MAQTAAAANEGVGLEEVVVTATRQTNTVNRVPLSITAETQKTLDQKGIKTVQDLQQAVPGIVVTQSQGSGVANFAIRGIVQGLDTAATVGFYLDDTPLTKRNVTGGVATANGTPLPALFDLERVEVLRGPQGTLFGSGSEGGTIRYITPQPSLTRYSALARLEASNVKAGGTNWEGGAAVGGPIVKDKLGFRASFYRRYTAGFIDFVNPYTSQVTDKNVNDGTINLFRGALTWAPTDRSKVTLSYLSSRDETAHNSSLMTLPTNQPLVVPPTCYNTRGIELLQPGSSARSNPPPIGRGAATCAALTAAGTATYTQPGGTFGPYPFKPYQQLNNLGPAPTKTNLQVATLTLDYDFGSMNVKSITSYIDDQTKRIDAATDQVTRTQFGATYGAIPVLQGIDLLSGYPTVADGNGNWFNNNDRFGLTQEIRFSSAGDAQPFSWVAGIFYSHLHITGIWDNRYDNETLARYLYGISAEQRYGFGTLIPGAPDDFAAKRQFMKDVEIAGFAEGNYSVTDKLRLTAGVRISRTSFDFKQQFFGPFAGFPIPTVANGGENSGSTTESPITPKFGAQYQISNNDMVYVTAAKGFRSGGINSYIYRTICQDALNVYKAKETDIPLTWASDSVWSYEGGAKLRLFNRLQLNGSVYQIDWKNPQISITPGFNCGAVTTYNGTKARSRGFELEAQVRLFWGFSANANVGYDVSKYLTGSQYVFPSGVALVTSLAGQKFALPPYTFAIGVRYDGKVADMDVYAQANYRYAASYETVPFGTAGWNPDANFNPSQERTNVRVGVVRGNFDLNLFANNLFNLERGNISGGRAGCLLPVQGGTEACTTFGAYNPFRRTSWGRPREIGIQINYRQ